MLIVLLVLSAFLSGLLVFSYIENTNDMFKLVLVSVFILITVILTILTYVEAYQI